MSTYPAEIIRTAGIVLMIASAVGICLWFLWNHLSRRRIAALAFLVIGLSAEFWVYWITEHRPEPPKKEATKPPAPPAAVPSWVTRYEIEEYAKAGKSLLNRSPAALLELGRSGGSLTGYLGNWIKIDYPFESDSLDIVTINKKQYYRVKLNAYYGWILAHFDAQKWKSKLILMLPKDRVRAYCVFERVDSAEYAKGAFYYYLIAYECELI